MGTIQFTPDLTSSFKEQLPTESAFRKCPICGTEWNRLRPCKFIDDSGRDAVNYICIDCAETVRSLKWIENRYPHKFATVELAPQKLPVIHIPMGQKGTDFERVEEYVMRHQQHAVIRAEDMTFIVRSQTVSPYLNFTFTGSPKTHFADNIFAAWSKVKRIIRNPISVEV